MTGTWIYKIRTGNRLSGQVWCVRSVSVYGEIMKINTYSRHKQALKEVYKTLTLTISLCF